MHAPVVGLGKRMVEADFQGKLEAFQMYVQAFMQLHPRQRNQDSDKHRFLTRHHSDGSESP